MCLSHLIAFRPPLAFQESPLMQLVLWLGTDRNMPQIYIIHYYSKTQGRSVLLLLRCCTSSSWTVSADIYFVASLEINGLLTLAHTKHKTTFRPARTARPGPEYGKWERGGDSHLDGKPSSFTHELNRLFHHTYHERHGAGSPARKSSSFSSFSRTPFSGFDILLDISPL